METNKEQREYIISIINSDNVYRNAFEIMYQSMLSNSPNLQIFKWVVLYPIYDRFALTPLFFKYANVDFIGYSPYESSDKYTLKFLLINYIKDIVDDFCTITYIDCDHIFLKEFYLPPISDTEILFSSENCFASIETSNLNLVHYNASFLRATLPTWKSFVDDWKGIYSTLYIESRFREEIAFSIAIEKNHIIPKQLDNLAQSNFQKYNKNCAFFHYGGEYKSSQIAKKFLVQKFVDTANLTQQQQWIIGKLSSYIMYI